jgi:NCS1 family nucleobase:cation symporter-1
VEYSINLDEVRQMNGQYRYWKNFNPAALIACRAAIVISIPFWNYFLIVSIVTGAIMYYILMKPSKLKIFP